MNLWKRFTPSMIGKTHASLSDSIIFNLKSENGLNIKSLINYEFQLCQSFALFISLYNFLLLLGNVPLQ